MELLDRISEDFVKIVFRIALVLLFLNSFSFVLTLIYRTNVVIALMSVVFSAVVTVVAWSILKMKKHKINK